MRISSGSRILVAALVASLLSTACSGDAPIDNRALRERMQYLQTLRHVSWLDFEAGNIYVGFSERPPDLVTIVNSALAVAHKAHGKSVHIYAVRGGRTGWRPGDGPIYCEASMRMGIPQKVCR